MLVGIPAGFAAMYIIDVRGLRASCLLGAGATTCGALLRCLSIAFDPASDAAFAFLICGQIVAGAGQAFLLGSTTKLAASWFDDKQRAFANTVNSLSNPLGLACASVIAPLFVTEEDNSNFDMMLWVLAGVTVALSLPVIFLQNRPPTPPSPSAEQTSREMSIGEYWKGIKYCFQSYAYICLFLVFGLGVGAFNALTNTFQQLLNPAGYTAQQAGLSSALLIGGGLIGAVVAGLFLDKTKRFITTIRFALTGAVACLGWFVAIAAQPDQLEQLMACSFLIGLFGFAILPASLELGAECTFPVVNEGTSTGILWILGQVLGVTFITLISGPLYNEDDDDMSLATYFIAGVGGLALVLSWLWRGRYARHENDMLEYAKMVLNNRTETDAGLIPNNSTDDSVVVLDAQASDTKIKV